MNRQFVLIVIAVAGIFAGSTAFAQHRPYDQVMKDIGATFAALRKNLDGNSAAAAVEDAAKLEELFKETEAFWTPFKTKHAIDLAKGGGEAAAAVAAAARGNDIKAAQAAVANVQKACANCHFTHREETGKGFVIKP